MNDTLTQPLSAERADLVAVLDKHRGFLRFTVRDLTDEQAAARPTVSELCLGGLIKHVTAAEKNWAEFSAGRGDSRKKFADMTAEDFQRRADEFRMLPGETLAGLLTEYDEVARRTNDLIQTLPDLDTAYPLPDAPWFTERKWSARRALMHIIAETAQHAGHADILREAIDGQKTMG